ncbi:MAG: 30S ribosomal protein S12 methylthiotransferase RimO [Thermodesulfobacteriota bacterium]|nr:30S ribosomal protein S12 methylthiotransferase RimO [Thermodesulfobacteriota bacterium]
MPNEKKIHVVTLGCARNQVDSEVMAGGLKHAGWTLVDRPETAHVIVVNTCSFIESAVDESIDTILVLAEFKRKGACRRLLVTGCLPERYREATGEALSEVDVFLGTGAYDRIVEAVEGIPDGGACLLPDPDTISISGGEEKRLIGRVPSAYLKIAEGCNRSCTYCIIPKLRGRQKSRPADDILMEAQTMIAAGVKELVLVAQESTHYGADLTPKADLAGLLRTLAGLSNRIWIRILYGHPESIHTDIIETIAETPCLLPYFDLPIQHASNGVLKKMGRRYGAKNLLDLFGRIRSRVPEAVLRTTVITGFPGETEYDFKQLMGFVRQVRFDHLGVFTYSDAEDLPSHQLPDPVPANVAQERYDHLMTLQMAISREKNQRHIGQKTDVLVEEMPEAGLWMGRTAFQAPEVDGVTYIRAKNGPNPVIGDFIRAKIIDAMEYDLVGEMSARRNSGE